MDMRKKASGRNFGIYSTHPGEFLAQKASVATMNIKMIRLAWIFLTCAGLCLNSCNSGGSKENATGRKNHMLQLRGYERSNPSIVHLPETLGEISGIVYYPKDSSIICLNDNEGVLYKFFLFERVNLQRWPFSTGEDFEEIVLHDSTFYAIQSDGSITILKAASTGFVKSVYDSPNDIKLREFEAVVYDTTSQLLLLICKDCEDDSTNVTSVWGYNTRIDSMLPAPVFRIDQTAIERILGKTIEKFKPSAAGVHPVTGDYYLVSAINDLIVVIDRQGVVKEACAIDKVLFKQPEGLTFMPNGDLLISNEYADVGRATILLYSYNSGSVK